MSKFFIMLKEFDGELKVLRSNAKELGNYFTRKGVASIATSRRTMPLKIISLRARATWSMDSTKEHYLKYENKTSMWIKITFN